MPHAVQARHGLQNKPDTWFTSSAGESLPLSSTLRARHCSRRQAPWTARVPNEGVCECESDGQGQGTGVAPSILRQHEKEMSSMTQSEVVQMVSKVLALGVLFAFLVGCGGGGSTMPGPGIQEPVQPVPPPDPDPVPPPDPDPVPSSNTDPVTYWQGNSLAEDLSEHWNSTNSLQSALGLLDGEEGAKTSLQTLIAGAESLHDPKSATAGYRC